MLASTATAASRIAGRVAVQGRQTLALPTRLLSLQRLRPGGNWANRPLQQARRLVLSTSERRALQVCASAVHGNGTQPDYDFDLFTIGAGSGGVRASRFAATNYGAKVAICELPFALVASDSAGGAGGTCVLRGCVPKKLMVIGGEFAEAFRDSVGFGWAERELPDVQWQRFMENKNKELDRLNGVYKKLLDGAKVTYIEGRGRLLDPHTVEVDGKRFTAKHILIATGARAFVPDIPGAEHAIISDDILNLSERPKKLAIVGGGYIALEFAGIFNNYGSDVHVFYRQKLPLRGFDEECREFIADQYKVHGLNLHPEHSPTKIEKGADGKLTLWAKSKDGQDMKMDDLDHVLMATGRNPNTRNLGLEEIGVELGDKGSIVVDEYSRTNVPSVWAIGDVTMRMALTPVALLEGMCFAKNVFGGQADSKPDYSAIASAVFSSPPLATVGLSEEAAVKEHGDVDVFVATFRPMKNTLSGNPSKIMMKLIVDAKTSRVVGVHMIGPECAEIMQGMAVAVKMGVTKEQLDSVAELDFLPSIRRQSARRDSSLLLGLLGLLCCDAFKFHRSKDLPPQLECYHVEKGERGRLCRVHGWVSGVSEAGGLVSGSVPVPDHRLAAANFPEPLSVGMMGEVRASPMAQSEADRICAAATLNYNLPVVFLPRDNGAVFHTMRGQLIPLYMALRRMGMLATAFKLITRNGGNLPPTRAELFDNDMFTTVFDTLSGTYFEELNNLPKVWCAPQAIMGIDLGEHLYHHYDTWQPVKELLPQREGVVGFATWFQKRMDIRRQRHDKPQMLFIQRSHSRRLANDLEIIAAGEARGFQVQKVDFAELKLRQQLQLPVDADLVIGAHGNAYGWMPIVDHSAVVVEVQAYKHGGSFAYGFTNLARLANVSYIVWHNTNPEYTLIDPGMNPDDGKQHSTVIPKVELGRILDAVEGQLAIPADQRSRDDVIVLNERVE
ncbi:hypothetical protein WJX72_002925 [[Myrmecia] bisecta]|uniref:glutathione-disulfide reductase n=1 Tax=[Myrmecia] bisecta TaxID=41462 RepID=A0AAW1P8X5_9CHLO